MRKQIKRRNLLIAVSIAIGAAGIILGTILYSANHKTTHTMIENTGYTTVLPLKKTIAQLGGWKKVSPENTSAVYAYNDTVNGVAISVSEQPLPASFEDNVSSSVAKLATAYNATATNQVGDMIIYIGSSAKGPQSVIFSKKGVLILIKSENKIEDAAWSNYAASLN